MTRSLQISLSPGGDVSTQLAAVLKGTLARMGGSAKARAQQIIAEEMNDRSGKLLTSTNFTVQVRGGNVLLEFYNDAGEYAAFHEYGTGIYGPKKQRITPKNGEFLAWKDPKSPFAAKSGKYKGWVFARSVRGVPPKRYMSRAIQYAIDQETGRVT